MRRKPSILPVIPWSIGTPLDCRGAWAGCWIVLNGRTRFRQRPLREGWEFEWLPVLIERDPHLGEVVKVTPQAVTTGSPLERLRFRLPSPHRCRHGNPIQ